MGYTLEQYYMLLGKKIPKEQKKTTSIGPDTYTSNVKGWRTIGGKKYYFKSLYEINYAHTLEFLKQNGSIFDWEYEPQLFRFPKADYNTSPFFYKPDYLVTYSDGTHEWHEVKGWMNPSSKKKIKRFNKHYPDEKLIIIGADWFNTTGKNYKKLIPGWESLPPNASARKQKQRKTSRR